VEPGQRGGRVVGEKSVANSDATEIEADDGWAEGMTGVDDFEAPAAEVDVKSGGAGGGELACGEGDEATFGVAGEEGNLATEDARGWKKEGLAIAGKAKSAGGDGDDFAWMKNADFALEAGEESKSASRGSGLDFSSESDTLAEAYGISFFVMEAEGGAGLFGEKEFKGVGAEVEDGGADGRAGHKEVKADC